jgi:transcriptional regulator GlxA family with amidase domain
MRLPDMYRTVAIVALDGVQSLDVVGPMEVFAVANRFTPGQVGYRLMLASTTPGTITTHAGLELGPAGALDALPDSIDTVVLAGGSEAAMQGAVLEGRLVDWLRFRSNRSRRMASVCTGAFLLAAAGLLDGRRASTHWNNCQQFRELFPAVRLEPDAIFVVDPPFYTSAGVTAGIDLCLALVEEDFGHQVALAVARELVLFLRRPGGQSQFGAGLDIGPLGHSRMDELIAAIFEDPTGDLDVPSLARRAAMSERSFARRFRHKTGMAPGGFVEQARLMRAKHLLETSDWPLKRVGERAGFGSTDAMQRSFQKKLGITPNEYRARFAPRDPGSDAGTLDGRARSAQPIGSLSEMPVPGRSDR